MYDDKQSLNFIKFPLHINGLDDQRSIRFLIHKFVLLPGAILLFSSAVYNLRYVHDISTLAKVFEAMATLGHVNIICSRIITAFQLVVRKIMLLNYASLYQEILAAPSQFWSINAVGHKFGEQLKRKMFIYTMFAKCMVVEALVLCTYMVTSPLFEDTFRLPQASYFPDGFILRCLLYATQALYMYEISFMSGYVDGAFMMMCGELEAQFHLLKKTLSLINIGDGRNNASLKKIKACVVHHCFLLQVFGKMKKMFSLFFLVQCLLTVDGICVQFCLLNEELSPTQFGIALLYISATFSQCACTFIPASNLEIEAETLPDVIYSLRWYHSREPKIRQLVLFMMMNAQKPVNMTGAGLFVVNRTVFLQILRIGFSISTILK